MQMMFTEKDPTKWKALIADRAPWATIIEVVANGIIAFQTQADYDAWKATQ